MKLRTALPAIIFLCLPLSALAELQTYDIDVRYRQEVLEALRGVLQVGGDPAARIVQLPTGQLLIDTRPEVHEQIEGILATIESQSTAAPPQITLRYWAVLGTADAVDNGNVPEILADVLDEIESSHGDLGFRLLGNATLITESGQKGEIEGDPLSVSQQTFAQDSVLNAEIGIRFVYTYRSGSFSNEDGANPFQTIQRQTQRVELRTTLERDDFVVVAENSLGENVIDGETLAGTVFYIVHWPEER